MGSDLVTILVAVIGGLSLILAACVTVLIPVVISARRHARDGAQSAAAANEQVSNAHPINLRDENDARHAQEMQLLRTQGRRLGRIVGRLGRIEKRLDIVEDTIPKGKRVMK